MWICPECNRRDMLQVSVVTSANLRQIDDEHFETEIEGDHEWDGDSTMSCMNCGYKGAAVQFECNLPLGPVDPRGPMPRRRVGDFVR